MSKSPIRFEELSHAQFLSLASDGEDGLIARIEERAAQRAECTRNTFVVSNQHSQTRREEYEQVLGLRCPTHSGSTLRRQYQRHIIVLSSNGVRDLAKRQYSLLELAPPPRAEHHPVPKSGTRAKQGTRNNRRTRAA